MKGMEVIKKCHKRYEECDEDMQYDESVMRHIMKILQCRPPYWNSIATNFSTCTSQEKLEQAGILFFSILYGDRSIISPCSEIKDVNLDYIETEDDYLGEGLSSFRFYFDSKEYKEIRQVRAYGLMALFGNVGGFVGILLGYAFVQIPGFAHSTLVMLNMGITKTTNNLLNSN